jgi:adenylate kinase
MGQPLDGALVLTADDEAIVERITGRRVCPSTGKVYHVRFMPPKAEGVDDETGEPLIQRDDDKEEVVRNRLATYYKQTEPVIDYYRTRGQAEVIEVDGNRPPEQVTASMIEACKRLGEA